MGDQYSHEQRRDGRQSKTPEEDEEARDEEALHAQARQQAAWNDYLRGLLDEDPRRVRAERARRRAKKDPPQKNPAPKNPPQKDLPQKGQPPARSDRERGDDETHD